MPRVTFYLLSSGHMTAEQFACRLTDKAWQSGFSVHIHTADQKTCQTMDQLLWNWREDSFLPHEISNTENQSKAPITIGHEPPGKEAVELLINLAPEPPEFYAQFQRVCEIVVNHGTETVEASRNKFRKYREAGIEPETHKITEPT